MRVGDSKIRVAKGFHFEFSASVTGNRKLVQGCTTCCSPMLQEAASTGRSSSNNSTANMELTLLAKDTVFTGFSLCILKSHPCLGSRPKPTSCFACACIFFFSLISLSNHELSNFVCIYLNRNGYLRTYKLGSYS